VPGFGRSTYCQRERWSRLRTARRGRRSERPTFPDHEWVTDRGLRCCLFQLASDGAPGPAIGAADFTGQRVGDRPGAAVHVFFFLGSCWRCSACLFLPVLAPPHSFSGRRSSLTGYRGPLRIVLTYVVTSRGRRPEGTVDGQDAQTDG
jgi:hypothetical protein